MSLKEMLRLVNDLLALPVKLTRAMIMLTKSLSKVLVR
jgi:hypothetical protein